MALFSTHPSVSVEIPGLGHGLKGSAAGRLALRFKAGENSFG